MAKFGLLYFLGPGNPEHLGYGRQEKMAWLGLQNVGVFDLVVCCEIYVA
jgi:hypothetical protein